MRKSVRLSSRIAITAAVTLIAATAGALGLAGPASAAPAVSRSHSASCDAGTLDGTYLFAANGWLTSGGTAIPFAFSGHETYSGDGTVHGVLTSSADGAIAQGTAFTGTYTVAANCTGSLVTTLGGNSSHYDLYISPSGDDFTYTQTDSGVVLGATEHRAD